MCTLSISIIIILLSLLHVISAFSPTDHYLIDCGSHTPTTLDSDGRCFTSDSSSLLSSAASTRLVDPNPPRGTSPILSTARAFTTPSSYKFQIKEKGTHLVRLHFHKIITNNWKKFDVPNSQFHVLANGHVLLYDFSVGSFPQTPSVHDYMLWVDDDELVITFMPSETSQFAFVNAIEVISAPRDLVADVAVLVNSAKVEKIEGLMKNSLETVYRVNVGGPKVTPFNDSLWRTWIPDDEFLKTRDGSRTVHFGGRIKYRPGGASREVGPDNMYNSARVISTMDNSIPKSNITWEFPLIGGYKYLVRLHFCDIASVSLGLIYFNVYVNGNLAYENLDLSEKTNWLLASPIYTDFVVDEGREKVGVLSISVGPSNTSMAQAIDGILNGIEIIKMNNSMGSLNGEVSTESVLMSGRRRRSSGCLVPLVAALCFLVIALVMINRKWDRVKNSVAWTPLPVSEVDLKSIARPSVGKA